MLPSRSLLVLFLFLLAVSAFPSLAGQESAWLAEVQERIATEEYQVTWQDHTVLPGLEQAWHAPNRSHDLRTYFTEGGIRVVRRTESEPS